MRVDQARPEELQRDEPIELRIARFVDDAHAAVAELFEDFVAHRPRRYRPHVRRQRVITS